MPRPSRHAARAARRELNRELELDPRPCEVGPLLAPGLARAGAPFGCTGRATCWHELRKRSAAGSVLEGANRLAACWWCNGAVEDHPAVAHEAGAVLRDGDPGFAEAGRGGDLEAAAWLLRRRRALR